MKTCIIGASGYTGAELARLIHQHPVFELHALYVSTNSADAGKTLNQLYPKLTGQIELPLTPLTDESLGYIASEFDLVFLATPHQASHDWADTLLAGKAKVFDLSGAFRLQDRQVFARYYGFEHQQQAALSQAVYGLAEWYAKQISQAKFVAVPGCYPTASLLATKPLSHHELLDESHYPIINATSGVSGAGRKAALNTSFCEVSLQAYGILSHRHTPEIAAYLGHPVVFTPHLGNFKRGILATTVCRLKYGVTEQQVNAAFQQAYADQPMVRLLNAAPKLDDVVGLNYADIYWQFDQSSGHLVVTSAIDNLLKGAASQAVQCANLASAHEQQLGLVCGTGSQS